MDPGAGASIPSFKAITQVPLVSVMTRRSVQQLRRDAYHNLADVIAACRRPIRGMHVIECEGFGDRRLNAALIEEGNQIPQCHRASNRDAADRAVPHHQLDEVRRCGGMLEKTHQCDFAAGCERLLFEAEVQWRLALPPDAWEPVRTGESNTSGAHAHLVRLTKAASGTAA